ncbi:indole-3-glycerol phosphate synthase TrpC [Paenibacillus beijingensis]|uniref:Indole-3-glycerol phosphate synthase n=1 Tax=Paenibacillus beijingensis TaxID=1126833 RepID=A0A0D5NPI8_9BACL|nr:indole-3-glycerol phosphate synthase TrpC [Paenibacillus beijingensis]AJY77161.1 indole-3-glycerol phosphate synthase [Paenibacillus beijingensis]
MFLDKIVATKRAEVAALAERFSLSDYERTVSAMPECRGFTRVLTTGRNRPMGLIAEVKKASPSKGLIRADFHPAALAQTYEQAGADCISVLTDRDYFQGSNDYLTLVRETVKVPLLRKDFVIDYRQIYEARAIGADAVLLIVAILTLEQLRELYKTARSIGLDVLVEVHNEREMETALQIEGIELIGINNRDLHTFVTDLKTTERLIGVVPKGVNVISESAIAGPEDLAYLQSVGAEGVLIGEHFMRQSDVGEAVERLMGPAVRS